MSNIELYRQAINEIDDYFEYQNESAKDKKRVMTIIDQMTDQLSILSEKVTIYGVVGNDGAGGVYLCWFLTPEAAARHEDTEEEGFGESTITPVETFVGSNIYKRATE